MDGALPGDFRDNNKDADFIVALEKIPLNTTYVVLLFRRCGDIAFMARGGPRSAGW